MIKLYRTSCKHMLDIDYLLRNMYLQMYKYVPLHLQHTFLKLI